MDPRTPRMDPTESIALDGVGAVMSARVAEERSRSLGQKSAEKEEKFRRDQASDKKERKLSARKQVDVFSPGGAGAHGKAVVDTR